MSLTMMILVDSTAVNPSPTPNVGVLLFLAHRALEERALRAVQAAGAEDLTPSQARLLQRVDPGGTRLVELAERALVTKQSAGFLVDQLEKGGYVVRVPDPDDGRARLVRLTPRAERLVPVGQAAVDATLAEWRDHLGAARMRHLVDALTRLREVTDPFA